MKLAFIMNMIMMTAADIVPLIWILMIWSGLCSRAVKSVKCIEQEMIIVSSGGKIEITQTIAGNDVPSGPYMNSEDIKCKKRFSFLENRFLNF